MNIANFGKLFLVTTLLSTAASATQPSKQSQQAELKIYEEEYKKKQVDARIQAVEDNNNANNLNKDNKTNVSKNIIHKNEKTYSQTIDQAKDKDSNNDSSKAHNTK